MVHYLQHKTLGNLLGELGHKATVNDNSKGGGERGGGERGGGRGEGG